MKKDLEAGPYLHLSEKDLGAITNFKLASKANDRPLRFNNRGSQPLVQPEGARSHAPVSEYKTEKGGRGVSKNLGLRNDYGPSLIHGQAGLRGLNRESNNKSALVVAGEAMAGDEASLQPQSKVSSSVLSVLKMLLPQVNVKLGKQGLYPNAFNSQFLPTPPPVPQLLSELDSTYGGSLPKTHQNASDKVILLSKTDQKRAPQNIELRKRYGLGANGASFEKTPNPRRPREISGIPSPTLAKGEEDLMSFIKSELQVKKDGDEFLNYQEKLKDTAMIIRKYKIENLYRHDGADPKGVSSNLPNRFVIPPIEKERFPRKRQSENAMRGSYQQARLAIKIDSESPEAFYQLPVGGGFRQPKASLMSNKSKKDLRSQSYNLEDGKATLKTSPSEAKFKEVSDLYQSNLRLSVEKRRSQFGPENKTEMKRLRLMDNPPQLSLTGNIQPSPAVRDESYSSRGSKPQLLIDPLADEEGFSPFREQEEEEQSPNQRSYVESLSQKYRQMEKNEKQATKKHNKRFRSGLSKIIHKNGLSSSRKNLIYPGEDSARRHEVPQEETFGRGTFGKGFYPPKLEMGASRNSQDIKLNSAQLTSYQEGNFIGGSFNEQSDKPAGDYDQQQHSLSPLRIMTKEHRLQLRNMERNSSIHSNLRYSQEMTKKKRRSSKVSNQSRVTDGDRGNDYLDTQRSSSKAVKKTKKQSTMEKYYREKLEKMKQERLEKEAEILQKYQEVREKKKPKPSDQVSKTTPLSRNTSIENGRTSLNKSIRSKPRQREPALSKDPTPVRVPPHREQQFIVARRNPAAYSSIAQTTTEEQKPRSIPKVLPHLSSGVQENSGLEKKRLSNPGLQKISIDQKGAEKAERERRQKHFQGLMTFSLENELNLIENNINKIRVNALRKAEASVEADSILRKKKAAVAEKKKVHFIAD